MKYQTELSKLIAKITHFKAHSEQSLERFRIENKKHLKEWSEILKTCTTSDEKAHLGRLINEFKQVSQSQYKKLKSLLRQEKDQHKTSEDYTKPGYPYPLGTIHPISFVRDRICDIFFDIGFSLSQGPEIEDDYHNFTALNFPPDHPARDMQDTFFISQPQHLLRTHTSSSQIRYMKNNAPPIRTITPGRVYRNETISDRSHCMFHQVEGLYVDKNVSFGDLKKTIQYFTVSLFGKSKIRLRASYFPFTEPSAEVDVYWGLNSERDYKITKGTGWLEIMGCGMVDPEVFENVGIDPKKHTGFAFGMGIERIAMLLYGIPDIRFYFQNDYEFLQNFSFYS